MADKPKRSLFHFTLAGMDELGMFRTPESRDRAVAEFGNTITFGRILPGIAINAAVVVGIMLAVQVIGTWLPGAMWLRDVGFLAARGVMFLVVRWLHRRGAAKFLRQQLVEEGVSICVECGYRLDGLGATTERCPECGAGVTPGVREILVARRDVQGANAS